MVLVWFAFLLFDLVKGSLYKYAPMRFQEPIDSLLIVERHIA